MKKTIVNWVLSAFCLYILSFLFKGIYFSGLTAALTAALVLGLVNAIIKPILTILSFPITILTLGLFSLVINAIMLNITSGLVPGFYISSFSAGSSGSSNSIPNILSILELIYYVSFQTKKALVCAFQFIFLCPFLVGIFHADENCQISCQS